MSVIVIFDGLCPICRTFAAILRSDLPPDWRVVAWEDFCHEPQNQAQLTSNFDLNELQILVGDRLLIGESAWGFLIKHAPQFRAYQNIAARMGITRPRQARIIRLFGTALRNICPLCRKQAFKSR